MFSGRCQYISPPLLVLSPTAIEKGICIALQKHNDSSGFMNWDWRVELLTFADLTLLSICLSMDGVKCSKHHVKGNKPHYLLLLLLRHTCFCLAMPFQEALKQIDYFIWGGGKLAFYLSSLKEGCYLRKQEERVEREEKVYLTSLLGLCLV